MEDKKDIINSLINIKNKLNEIKSNYKIYQDLSKEELICITAPYNENDNFFKKVPSLYHYARFLETQEGIKSIDNLK